MEYKKKEYLSHHLHMIKTKRFKEIKVRVIFRNKIKKEEITIRNFLGDMLTYSSKKYKTARELAIASQELYSLNVSYNGYRTGNYNVSNFLLSFLDPKYTEKDMFEKSIAFLSDILFNPNVNNRKFNKESFEIIKSLSLQRIDSVKENTKTYSTIRMLENMDNEAPFSYRSFGYKEDLLKITEEDLYDYYDKFIKDNIIDIFVLGNIDFEYTDKVIKENFKFHNLRIDKINPYIDCIKSPRKIRTIIEKDDSKQSKLSIGCRLVKLNNYERKYPLTLFNIILGSGTDSKFFKEIREQHSLAYYIYSVCNKPDNTMIISSGINRNDMNKVVKLVKEKLKDMRTGKFSEEDLEKAKILFKTSIEEIEDQQYTLMEAYYAMSILDVDDIETRKKKMLEVTKEEIIKVAKKVKIDTIYLLEGTNDEED